jgi:hypothetical protein
VAVIERATLPEQREVVTTLDRLAADARDVAVRAPALIVVGAAVELRALAALVRESSAGLDEPPARLERGRPQGPPLDAAVAANVLAT